MNKGAAEIIEVCGKTTDGKSVVCGLYRFFETTGLPLDVIFEWCREKDFVPDWLAFMEEAVNAGMKPDRVVAKLDLAIVDSFGTEIRDVVVARLNERIAAGL